jgi:cyclase
VQAHGGLCIANAGLLAGPEGVTAIDTLFTPVMTRTLLDEAKRVASDRIIKLVNTHHHVDHTLGNALFPEDTEVLAHAKAKAEMQRSGLTALGIIKRIAPHFEPELEGVTERLPSMTFNGDTLEITAGGRTVRLLHYGIGHTRGDILAYLPAEKILFTGDLAFHYVTPLAHEGHIGNWITIARRVLDEVDADVIVPGHGPVGTKADFETFVGYLRLVHDAARKAFDAGASVQEATRAIDLGEYAEWTEAERLAINVGRCYQEFRGEIEGAP